jgi:hypothetical protein
MPRPVAVTALAVLALAGCGDGLSADEYRREAGRICREASRTADRVARPRAQSAGAVAGFLERLVDANERVIGGFEELEPPAELEGPHDELLAENRRGVEVVRGTVRRLRGGGDLGRELQAVQTRLRPVDERADRAAERLGVPACAQD